MADISKFSSCLFVKKSDATTDIKELWDRNAVTYNTTYEYYQLREILSEPPERFFSRLDPSPNGISSLYSLAMKNVNAAFSNDLNIKLMKVDNPGPIKMIRAFTCTKPYIPIPVFKKRSRRVTEENPILYGIDPQKR